MDYREKYFKYKSKYLSAKQVGGLGGHLQVYFLTQSDYDTLKNDPKHNFKIPGTKVALTGKNDSGLSNKYPHILEHHIHVYDINNNKKDKKGNPEKIQRNLGKDMKFDYTNPEHILILKNNLFLYNKNKDVKYIMLIRDYSVLHDVFVGTFEIKDNNTLEFKKEF